MKLALKRLAKEYRELTTSTPEGVASGPVNEDNLLEWEALITGPEDTCYDGGCFHAKLSFPRDYPLNPPKMQFTSQLWHPNIYPDGTVCISILHPPGEDKYGYEKTCERWSPVQSVEKILLSVVSMLAEPNDESPANVEAAKMWRTNRKAFDMKADECVRKSIGLL
mmetsp:Transcript_3266/g.3693  ORF Transcript_3266/g.3693 Transcript_3266/m.3693 type:complete len:166 (-) Transcript_3266:53-550(-)